MARAIKDIEKEIRALSLAHALIESLDGEPDPGAEEAWKAEIQRRTAELDSGSVETVPWSEVRGRLRRGYK